MISGVATMVISTGVVAVSYPLYLHFLGYEQYGVWLVLATVLTFAQLGNLGVSQAVMKLVAEEHGRGNYAGVQQYVASATVMLAISGTVVLSVIIMFRTSIVGLFDLSEENIRTVLWLLPYVGCFSVYVLIVHALNATLSGLGRMDLANYVQLLGRVIAVMMAGWLLYRGWGIEGLLIGNTISYVIVHAISVMCVRQIAPIRFLRLNNISAECGTRLLRFGGTLFGGSVIAMLFNPFNKLILTRYAGIASVPFYDIAFTGSMQVRGLFEAGFRALMPEISRASADVSLSGLDRVAGLRRRSVKLILSIGLLVYAILMLGAPYLLHMWLREKYSPIISAAFRIMLLGTYFHLLAVPAFHGLMGRGHVGDILIANLVQSVTNVILITVAIGLMTRVTVSAICIATVVSMLLSAVYLIVREKAIWRECRVTVQNTQQ